MALADNIAVGGVMVGLFAYVTNLGGFRDWVTEHMPGVAPPGVFGDTGGDEKSDTKPKPVKNDPPPRTGSTFNCVTYPRCNTQVSGTDARKKCCCNNKCALLGRTMKSVNLFTGECLCNPKTTPSAPTPASCTGACPLGKRWAIVNGRCSCINCANTCGSCYDRVANCACKLNTNKLTHSDTYCKSTCGGYSCWTNYPCPNRGARAQKCVKGTCAQARTAWIAAYSCKSSVARAYPTRYPQEALDEGMMQVPTLA